MEQQSSKQGLLNNQWLTSVLKPLDNYPIPVSKLAVRLHLTWQQMCLWIKYNRIISFELHANHPAKWPRGSFFLCPVSWLFYCLMVELSQSHKHWNAVNCMNALWLSWKSYVSCTGCVKTSLTLFTLYILLKSGKPDFSNFYSSTFA